MTIPILFICFVIVLTIIFLSYEYYEHKTGVPTFPTMPWVRKRMAAIIKEDFEQRHKEGEPWKILDIGSGSGQLARYIALSLPQATVTGIELSPIPVFRARFRQKLMGPDNVTYLKEDFWPFDVSEANVMLTYLPGKIMDRVGEKLRKELKSGTLIVSNVFWLRHDWEPIAEETLGWGIFKTRLFVYRA